MRALLPLLLTGAGLAVEPLATGGADASSANDALMDVAKGDARRLTALGAALFAAPAAVADPHSPLLRRWTQALPAALARLDEPARREAIAILDQLARAALAAGGDPREAMAFLPAPSARAAVERASDSAFDRGRLEDFLCLGLALDACGAPAPRWEERRQAALALLGRGPLSAAALPAPGTPITDPRPLLAERRGDGGLTVAWARAPGWILACAPWGGVLWQLPVALDAEIVCGAGAALVRDAAGLRAVREDGVILPLRPPPGRTRMLAVGGGAAWFATGRSIWRYGLDKAQVARLDLDDEPLGPPLLRGGQQCWLTRSDLILAQDQRIIASVRHHLPAGAGWSLGEDRRGPLVRDGAGGVWRIEAIDEQLRHLDAWGRARLLLAAGRPADARSALAGGKDEPETRRLLLACWLAEGLPAAAAAGVVLDGLAIDDESRARLANARFLAGGIHALDALPPTAWIGSDARSPVLPIEEWPHACRADALRTADALPRPDAAEAFLPASEDAAPLASGAWRGLDGALHWRGLDLRLESRIDRSQLRCSDAAGERWRVSWQAPSLLSSPATSIEVAQGCVMVWEGDDGLRAFDAGTGTPLAVQTPAAGAVPGQSLRLADGRIASLAPLGVRTQLRLGADAVDLPAPARWMLPLGDAVLVVLGDGRALRIPGLSPVHLPAGLAEAAETPGVDALGAVAGGRRFRWKMAAPDAASRP